MPRAVLDANVIVSGIASLRHGQTAPPRLLRLWRQDAYELVTSSAILAEVRQALEKPYFSEKRTDVSVTRMLNALGEAVDNVPIDGSVSGIAAHRHDDPELETALEGDADHLVTGDKELLALDHPFSFRIVHPAKFLAILERDDASE